MARVDRNASTVIVKQNGILCVDGIQIMRVVFYNGEPWLQFYDRNKRRCRERGDPCVEVPLDEFFSRVVGICDKRQR